MYDPVRRETDKLRHFLTDQIEIRKDFLDDEDEREDAEDSIATFRKVLAADMDTQLEYVTGLFMAGVTFGNPNDEDFDGFGSWTDDIGQPAPEDEVRPHVFGEYTLMGRYSLEYCYVGAAEKYVSRLVDKDNKCVEVASSRFNSDDLRKCCLASVKVAGVTDRELELPHHGCYLYEKLTNVRWTQVAITEGMARGLLGEIKVDGRNYDNKLFDLIRLDKYGRYMYVYKHDFDWLLVTAMPQ